MRAGNGQAAEAMDPRWLADVFVAPDGAEPPESGPDGVVRVVEGESYAANFGREWTWFSRTQLDEHDGEGESERAFFAKTGLSPSELDGAIVLDAGCGMGRFADVAHRYGARVVAVDLSDAVSAARANLPADVAVLQGDLRHLPLRPGSFDIVYSLGVLHHTPNTKGAFDALVPLVRPGGTLAIWVYSGERAARRAHRVSDLIRIGTTRLSHDTLLRLCRVAIPLGRLYRTGAGRRLYPLLPVSAHQDPEWRVLDTFDWYSPRYQWRHSWSEVESWFRQAGFVDVRRLGPEVAVSGRCPPAA